MVRPCRAAFVETGREETARRGLPGRRTVPSQRGVAHGLLQRPERRQVFGRAPGDEARAVAVAPDVHRQGPDGPAGQAVQQFQREPGEPGAAGQDEQAGGAEAQDGRDARGVQGAVTSGAMTVAGAMRAATVEAGGARKYLNGSIRFREPVQCSTMAG